MFGSRKDKNPSRRSRFEQGKSMPSYSYHNVRSDKEVGKGRDIKNPGMTNLKTTPKLLAEKFGLILLAIVVIVCLANVLYLSHRSIVILGGYNSNPIFKQNRLSVEQTADKLLSSSILNTNKLTANTRSIESALQQDYPLYSNISLTMPLIDRHPVIYLTPAQPALILTGASFDYLVNENGQTMLQGKSSSFNYLKLPVVSYQANSVKLGGKVLTTDEVKFIQTVEYELALKGNKVSSMTLPQGSSELDVYITALPYFTKFNLNNNDARQQAGSLLATQAYLKGQNIVPSQYIDVRTDGRVYYQ